MADPLSFTASIAAVTVPAMHDIRLLLDDLQRIADAPKTVKDLEDDIRSADRAATLLQAMKDSEWEPLGRAVADGTKSAPTSNVGRATLEMESYCGAIEQIWTSSSKVESNPCRNSSKAAR